tara:strand:- start:592 stop:2124 length:1533 start_codon:yes stop_codon:yes gene_type:complete
MKQIITNFNNFIKKTIFKVQNKTNNKFNINNLFKAQKKTNNKFNISKFNKYLITFISLLFFYLFYLLIPILYDKGWVQNNIENQLLKEFKTNFSITHDISYRILPSPHFLIKDSKIFRKSGGKIAALADVKFLKVFVSQKNFFNKEKITLKNIKINEANFSLLRSDFKLLKKNSVKKFSNKKIEVNKSNIFFKNDSNETISIIKISKAFLFLDSENLLNLFNLNGKVFNVPFRLDFVKRFNPLNSKEINITIKKLKLKIFDIYNNEQDKINNGKNSISFLNFTFNTDYKIKDDIVTFSSSDSKIKNTKINYNGDLSINPFNLNLNLNIDDYDLHELLNINLILNEVIKTQLLFNENISINTTIKTNSNLNNGLFQNTKINLNIINGKINFDETKFINKKIGSLDMANSNLFYNKDRLILNTDIIINVDNANKFFSLLQTNKKYRKPIKDILINLDYDFLTNQIEFNNFKIDNKKVNNELLSILGDFKDNNINNWNKSRRILNNIFENYEG